MAKSAQPESENRPWHCFHVSRATSNIHAFIASQCLTHSQQSCVRAQKTSLTLNFPLFLSHHIPPSHPMGRPISVMRMELGPLALCPCGGVLLKVEQPPLSGHIQSRSTAGSEPKPDIPPSLVARLLWQPGLLRMSDSGGSGFFVFSCCCYSGHFCFKTVVPSHWHWSHSAKDAVYWSQSKDTQPLGRLCVSDSTRNVLFGSVLVNSR